MEHNEILKKKNRTRMIKKWAKNNEEEEDALSCYLMLCEILKTENRSNREEEEEQNSLERERERERERFLNFSSFYGVSFVY